MLEQKGQKHIPNFLVILNKKLDESKFQETFSGSEFFIVNRNCLSVPSKCLIGSEFHRRYICSLEWFTNKPCFHKKRLVGSTCCH